MSPMLAVLACLAAQAIGSAAPCPSGPVPRVAFPYLPNPIFIDVGAVEELPHDRLYILIDDAVAVERKHWEEEPPPPTDRPTDLSSEALAPLAGKSVRARGQIVQVGDRWIVWHLGKRHEVRIREFAKFVEYSDGKVLFDEVYAIAGMTAELQAAVGPWDEYGYGRAEGRPASLLAAPFAASAAGAPLEGRSASVDRDAWVRVFRANLEEQWRRYADLAKIDRLPIQQCGERRTLAVLNVKTDDCSDYGCVAFSAVRIYGPGGDVIYRSGILDGLTEVTAGDVNGDGSDEIMHCRGAVECHVLNVRGGAIVSDRYDVESGC